MNLEKLLALGLTKKQAESVMESLKGNFVTKSRFDEVNKAKKRLEGDIETLKEEFDTQKELLQAEYEDKITEIKIDTEVHKALAGAGAKNTMAVKALLADFLKDAQLDGDKVAGLDEEISRLKEGDDTAFLFERPAFFKGIKPGEAHDGGESTPISLADAVKNYFER